jgi:hypothetical protein
MTLSSEQGEQSPGRDQAEATGDEFADLIPIDVAAIHAERDPAPRPDVGRQVKAIRLSRRKRCVITRQRFARDRDYSVAMMIVEEIHEGLLADEEGGVVSGIAPTCVGEGEADLCKAREAVVRGRYWRMWLQ